MGKSFSAIGAAFILFFVGMAPAQSPNDAVSPLPSPSVPAGPRPTATISPLAETPQPTATITPLPIVSPSGTQPQTTNTVTPSPSPDR